MELHPVLFIKDLGAEGGGRIYTGRDDDLDTRVTISIAVAVPSVPIAVPSIAVAVAVPISFIAIAISVTVSASGRSREPVLRLCDNLPACPGSGYGVESCGWLMARQYLLWDKE